MSTNNEKIDRISTWIDKCDSYLSTMQQFTKAHVQPRRWKGNELAEVTGVTTPSTIYHAEKDGRIPSAEVGPNGQRLGNTLDQIVEIQNHFGTSPRRLDDEEPQMISFINFKGGCYKTTTSLYAGSYFASLGYRVLLVDLDPQASLTLSCGFFPDRDTSYETTLAPYINEDEDFPLSTLPSIVRETHVHGLHIIPSCLDLAGIEFSLSAEVMQRRLKNDNDGAASVFFRIRSALDTIKHNYDIVIMDGTPSLGILPLNIILASDTVIVPLPTEAVDFASTRSFCKLYLQQAELLMEVFGNLIDLPEMLILPTRYSSSDHSATVTSKEILDAVRDIFKDACLKSIIRKQDSVVGNLSFFHRTVFDVNPGDCNVPRDARKKAMLNFSTVFDEILVQAVFPKWPSKQDVIDSYMQDLEDRGLV